MTHIWVSKLTSIGSDNGLSPGRRQAIIWTNAGILLIRPLGTNFSEILIEIHTFSFKKMHLKMSTGKWRSFCLGLNVFNKVIFHHTLLTWHSAYLTWILFTSWRKIAKYEFWQRLLVRQTINIFVSHTLITTMASGHWKYIILRVINSLWPNDTT